MIWKDIFDAQKIIGNKWSVCVRARVCLFDHSLSAFICSPPKNVYLWLCATDQFNFSCVEQFVRVDLILEWLLNLSRNVWLMVILQHWQKNVWIDRKLPMTAQKMRETKKEALFRLLFWFWFKSIDEWNELVSFV